MAVRAAIPPYPRPLRLAGCLLLAALAGCAAQNQATGLTLGQVQRTLRTGLSQVDVMEALGPPNIVSSDSEGHEVWTYDKVAKRSASRWFLFWQSGESAQRTMTVLITFESHSTDPATGKPDWRVADYKYHATQF